MNKSIFTQIEEISYWFEIVSKNSQIKEETKLKHYNTCMLILNNLDYTDLDKAVFIYQEYNKFELESIISIEF